MPVPTTETEVQDTPEVVETPTEAASPVPTKPSTKKPAPKPSKPTAKGASKSKPKPATDKETREERSTRLLTLMLKVLVAGGKQVPIQKVQKLMLDAGLSQNQANGQTYKLIYDLKYATWTQHEDSTEVLSLTSAGNAAWKKLS